MALVLNDSGSITGLSAGGLPDGSVTADDIASLPAGSVIQVVNATYNTATLSTSTSFADTGLTATITPTSATSKVLILVNQAGVAKVPGETQQKAQIRLVKDGTSMFFIEVAAAYNATSSFNYVGAASCSYLDSPNTTSAITYKTDFRAAVNAAGVYVQIDGGRSSITLMEIAA